MQIDFHHAVTYVLARWAGFDHADAATVAYASQYVDDAVNDGCLIFNTGEMFNRTATAHCIWDVRNLTDRNEDTFSWVPFHFLPGNCEGTEFNPDDASISDRLLCVKNSAIAQDMVEECIGQKGTPYGSLYRLGITMHVYADTWAHQDFAGIKGNVNGLTDLDAPENVKNFAYKIIPSMGHGEALCCPDLPFLSWAYAKKDGITKLRNNFELFVEAADAMTIAMRRYISGNPKAMAPGLSTEQKLFLADQFKSLTDIDADVRHQKWLDLIGQGHNSPFIASESLSYDANGYESWKFNATGIREGKQQGNDHPIYTPNFLKSDWKLFHDAVEYHRTFVLNVLLPKYGICAA